jgi:two-component system sensor histidine kinase VanS
MAEAMPPDHASAGITTAQLCELAYTAVAAAPASTPFQRGTEGIRTDHAGVGLGLAIVKSITQAHDGTLTLTPRAAGGLRVTVQLPAAPPHTGGWRQHLALPTGLSPGAR